MPFELKEPFVDSPCGEMSSHPPRDRAGSFTSVAVSNWEIVVTKMNGQTYFTVRGPETRPSLAMTPPDGEFLGIVFKLGAYMPHLPVYGLVDSAANLPIASSRAFWLQGAAWELPTFDNADTFIDRLVRDEVLVRDSVVQQALRGRPVDHSPRSVQRRFLRATGLTQGAVWQIERARFAANLLQQGVSMMDTVVMAGYADQPHMTRSLRAYVGYTPAQVIREAPQVPMSFLFKPEAAY